MAKRAFIVAAVCLGAVGFVGWTASRAPSVSAVRAATGPAVAAVYATGKVEPPILAAVAPKQSGVLMSIAVEEGEPVRAGQVLARLDAETEQAQRNEAAARLRYLMAEEARISKLAARGVASDEAQDRARQDRDMAAAALEAAEARLRDRLIRSSIDGAVRREDADPGALVGPSDVLFIVGGGGALRLNAEVDEEDISRVRVGQRALARADAFPERIFDGRVTEITPQGDPVGRVFRTYVSLEEPADLRIGMTAEVNIIVAEREDAVLVPLAAIEGRTVWVTDADGRARRRPVELGVFGEESVEVRAGLSAGEVVLTERPPGEGRRVTVRIED